MKTYTVEDFANIRIAFQPGKIYPVGEVYVSSIRESKYLFRQCLGRKILRRKDRYIDSICFGDIGAQTGYWQEVEIVDGVEVDGILPRADVLAKYEDLADRCEYWRTKKEYQSEDEREWYYSAMRVMQDVIDRRANEYDEGFQVELPKPPVEKPDTWTNALKFEVGSLYVNPRGCVYEVLGRRGKSVPFVFFNDIRCDRELAKSLCADSFSSEGWSRCKIVDGIEIYEAGELSADHKAQGFSQLQIGSELTRTEAVQRRSKLVIGSAIHKSEMRSKLVIGSDLPMEDRESVLRPESYVADMRCCDSRGQRKRGPFSWLVDLFSCMTTYSKRRH